MYRVSFGNEAHVQTPLGDVATYSLHSQASSSSSTISLIVLGLGDDDILAVFTVELAFAAFEAVYLTVIHRRDSHGGSSLFPNKLS
jgi:hypothetical protein